MEITDIKLQLVTGAGRLRAVATVVFDASLAVHDIKVIAGDDRLFLAMPSKYREGGYHDIVHPIRRELREEMERSILEVYHNACGNTRENAE